MGKPDNMEEQVYALVKKTWKKFQSLDASKRYLIALAGIPGSGKSTLAASIVTQINYLHHQQLHKQDPNAAVNATASQPDVAVVVPMDGYHLTRAALSAMPNPKEAHYRRGAAFTFDPKSYLKLIQKLRQPIEAGSKTIHAPSFDHHIKDPVQNDIHIPPTARLIIVEGLYTALDRDTWRDAAALYDEIWYLEIDIATATERVAKRNFKAGLSRTYEESLERTVQNDMRNAKEIMAEMVKTDEVIVSVEDERWKGKKPKAMETTVENVGGEFNEKVGLVVDLAAINDAKPAVATQERLDSVAALAAAGGGC